jgi:hypothetical protein
MLRGRHCRGRGFKKLVVSKKSSENHILSTYEETAFLNVELDAERS